jgi:tetratricopeptide (TPR) repeat protein
MSDQSKTDGNGTTPRPDLEALLKIGDVKAAKQAADERLAENPNDPEALFVRARLHLAEGEADHAAFLISHAEDLKAEETIIWKAILADQIGYPTAQELLEEACTTAKRYEPFFVLGRVLNSKAQFAEAKPYLEKALQLAPDQPVAHFQLAYALLEMGQIKEGVEHLKQCLQLAPIYTPAYLALSRLLEGNGNTEGAKHLLRQGLQLQPEEPELQSELARLITAAPPA